MKMRISFTDDLDDGRAFYPIGRVSAASGWRAAASSQDETARESALRALIATANEFEADAIVGVGFGVDGVTATEPPVCRSGDVLRGTLVPTDCPAFGKECTPRTPLGATMVSSEGACAAHWLYRSHGESR